MLNRCIIQGRLGQEPELRYTQNNTPICAVRLACERAKGKNGEVVTDWINAVMWRKTAEHVARWFQKGDMMLVEGRWSVREYQKQDGSRAWANELIAEQVHFCGGRKENTQKGERRQERDAARDEGIDLPLRSGYEGFAELADEEGEVPF